MRFALIVLSYFLMVAAVAKKTDANIWSTFQGNSGHTSFANVIVRPENFQVKWVKDITNHDDSFNNTGALVATDQAIYINSYYGSLDGSLDRSQLVALNAASGDIKWKFELLGLLSNPGYGNGKIYILGQASFQDYTKVNLLAYDAMSGELAFSKEIIMPESIWYLQSPVVDHQQLLIGTVNDEYNFDAQTGQMNWSSHDVAGLDVIANASSQYIIRLHNNSLVMLDRASGTLVSTVLSGAEGDYLSNYYPTIYDDNSKLAFAQLRAKELTAFDLQTQAVKWKTIFQNFIYSIASSSDTVFIVHHQSVDAADSQTGKINWSWTAPQNLNSEIIVTPNAVILGAESNIYILSRETHQVMSTIPTKSSCHIAVANSTLYFVNTNDAAEPGIHAVATAMRLN